MADDDQTPDEPQSSDLMIENDPPVDPVQPPAADESPADDKPDEETPPADDAPPKDDTPPAEPATPATPEPEQPKAVDDPGEFKPGDYSFDVELADGSKIHVEKPEDIDKLPQDADFGTPANLLKVQGAYTRMINGLENDRRAHDESQKAYQTQQEAAAEQQKFIDTAERELAYLETQGLIPAIPVVHQAATDWTAEGVKDQPGIKERLAIVAYMGKENAARDAAGLPRMTSMLEAHNAMQLSQMRAERQEAAKKAAETRKARGAMVGGSAPGHQSNVPEGMMVGSGGSLNDIM